MIPITINIKTTHIIVEMIFKTLRLSLLFTQTMERQSPAKIERILAPAQRLRISSDIVIFNKIGIKVASGNTLTAVSYDHMNILGNTIQEIAAEKAGIIKRGGDIVAYSNPPSVTAIIEKACREKGAKLHRTDFSGIKIIEQNMEGQTFSYKQYTALKISLLGEHQVKNAAVAVHVAEVLKNKGYNITEKAIRNGLLKARWPGRLEVLSKNPFFLIDGAHNAGGVAALKKSLDSLFPGQALTFIMGVLGDKDYQSMLAEILPGCAKLFTVTPNSGRALSAADLAKAAKEYCKNIQICDTVGTAVKKSLVETPKGGAICAFGSLFYIGEVRSILK